MQTTIMVRGMSCSHCENAVRNAVSAISGVTDVIVDLAKKTVSVTHDQSVTLSTIQTAIQEQGYEVA